MRFAIATAAILAESAHLTLGSPSLTSSSSSRTAVISSKFATILANQVQFDDIVRKNVHAFNRTGSRRLNRGWNRRLKNMKTRTTRHSSRPDVAGSNEAGTFTLSNNMIDPIKVQKATIMTSNAAVVTGQKKRVETTVIECDPKADQTTIPDVGILSSSSCGMTAYCKESEGSALGGICVEEVSSSSTTYSDSKRAYRNNNRKRSSGILKNSRADQKRSRHSGTQHDAVMECDPMQSPDVGILDCGIYSYCRADKSSTKGGICVSTLQDEGKDRARHIGRRIRRLQEDGNSNETATVSAPVFDALTTICNNPNYTCECNLDEVAYTADFNCVSVGPVCTDVPDNYCNTTNTKSYCVSYNYSGSVKENLYSYKECVEFSEATDFKYCTSYTAPTDGAEIGTCEISINDVICTGCTVLPRTDEDGEIATCFEFDCTDANLYGVTTGNTCYLDLTDAIAYELEYLHLPCESGCSLCKPGELMGSPDANIDDVDGSSVRCGDLQFAALTGYYIFANNTSYCSFLNPTVSMPCNCYNPLAPPNDDVSSDVEPPGEQTDAPTTTAETFFDYMGFICRRGSISEYDCSAGCEFDEEAGTGSINCIITPDCYDVPSLCTDPLNFCSSQTLTGSVQGPEEGYSYQVCYSFTSPYEFSYCISYTIAANGIETCELDVNGITCTSCSVDVGTDGYSCAVVDCRNTILGYTARLCDVNLMKATRDYFLYQALPCEDGCNLCGDGVMTNGTGRFLYNMNDQQTMMNCFEMQLKASIGPSEESFCSNLKEMVQDPCGCISPTPPIEAPITVLPPPPTSTNSNSSAGGSTTTYALVLSTTVTALSVVGAIIWDILELV